MWRFTLIQVVAATQVALVLGQVDPHPVGRLGVQGVPHGREVAQRAWREVVPVGGLQVDGVEGGQVGSGSDAHAHPGLRGLLDVAPPQLVHPG